MHSIYVYFFIFTGGNTKIPVVDSVKRVSDADWTSKLARDVSCYAY